MWTWIKRLFGKQSDATPAPASPNLPSVSTVSFTAAPHYPEVRVETPNKSRTLITPEAVVLHHSGGSYLGGIAWIADPKSNVSYHVLIARDGRRTVFGDDTNRMWHAGKSSWLGRPDLNNWSLGVSWEGDTHKVPLGEDALASGLEYLVPRMKRWGIPVSRVLTHAQVSPGRKDDISDDAAILFKSRLMAALS